VENLFDGDHVGRKVGEKLFQIIGNAFETQCQGVRTPGANDTGGYILMASAI
jgi:hypothetical protein